MAVQLAIEQLGLQVKEQLLEKYLKIKKCQDIKVVKIH